MDGPEMNRTPPRKRHDEESSAHLHASMLHRKQPDNPHCRTGVAQLWHCRAAWQDAGHSAIFG